VYLINLVLVLYRLHFGFCNLGDILISLEKQDNKEISSSPELANSMLVFLIRGLFTSPYAQFPCTSLSGEQMFDLAGAM